MCPQRTSFRDFRKHPRECNDMLKTIPVEGFQRCYQKMEERLHRCVAAQGNCFEEDIIDVWKKIKTLVNNKSVSWLFSHTWYIAVALAVFLFGSGIRKIRNKLNCSDWKQRKWKSLEGAEYNSLDLKNEEILELGVEAVENIIQKYKYNWFNNASRKYQNS